MSDDGHYILKLKIFESYIKGGWTSLQNDVDFSDVTLASDEDQIKAHKSVLSTCSPVLRNILKKNPHKHPLIYLFGIKFSHLVNLIDFMYQGEVKIPQHEINDLLNLGRYLQVVGLSENVEDAVVDINEEDSKKNGKSPSFKENSVDINIDIGEKKYRSESLDIGAKENNFYIMKDNATKKCLEDPLETDLTNYEESTEVSNGMDNNEDIHHNLKVILNEFPIHSSNTEELIENINETIYEKPIFSCDKCQYMATEHESFILHTKLVHEKGTIPSSKTDIEKTVEEIKKDDAQISYANYLMKTEIEEKIVGVNEDNVKSHCTTASLENNLLNKEIKMKKRFINESTKDFEVIKGHKRYKTDSSIKEVFENKVNDYERQDFNLDQNEFSVYNTSIEKKGENSNNFKCEQCSTKFTQIESLSRHIKSIHEGLRFSCDKCEYTATQDASLKRHIQSIHDKIRYFCDWCDYSATQKSILNKHIKLKH